MAYYERGVEKLYSLGYPLYRAATRGMALLNPAEEDGFWATVTRLKAALDPDGVIAPGRYEPGVCKQRE